MAHEVPGKKLTAIANGALTQYTFTKATTGTEQLTCSTATTAASGTPVNYLGVVQNAPVSGKAAELMLDGVSKVVCATAIKSGEYVTIAAGGQATLAAAGAEAAGIATSTTTGADQLVSVLLLRGVLAAPSA